MSKCTYPAALHTRVTFVGEYMCRYRSVSAINLNVLLRKSVDVEEVTIDPEAKWTYAEKKEGPVKSEPEGVLLC